MAVPLGQMQNRLVVAMLDAGNVQTVELLSNKIGKPLKGLFSETKKALATRLSSTKSMLGVTSPMRSTKRKAVEQVDEAGEPNKGKKMKIFRPLYKIRRLVRRFLPFWNMLPEPRERHSHRTT